MSLHLERSARGPSLVPTNIAPSLPKHSMSGIVPYIYHKHFAKCRKIFHTLTVWVLQKASIERFIGNPPFFVPFWIPALAFERSPYQDKTARSPKLKVEHLFQVRYHGKKTHQSFKGLAKGTRDDEPKISQVNVLTFPFFGGVQSGHLYSFST